MMKGVVQLFVMAEKFMYFKECNIAVLDGCGAGDARASWRLSQRAFDKIICG